MKKVYLYKFETVLFALILSLVSCNMDRDPLSEYSDKTVGNEVSAYATRAQMKTQYDGMYTSIRNFQEGWMLDFLVYTETHSDNAYRGSNGAELITLEQNRQDGDNLNIKRDWKSFLGAINTANRVILNVDKVPDISLTTAERKQWKAEAQIYRAWILFDMVRLWGGIPLFVEDMPEITSENIEDLYSKLYPKRASIDEVYDQIIKDLEEALEPGCAPDVTPDNKFSLNRGVANALLAKVYAEKPKRDYQKVISYCEKVEGEGYKLVPNYSDLFAVNIDKTDIKYRNTSESIFEIVYPQGSGNWITWMFGLDLCDPNSNLTWAKWVTPSRDLVAAFESEHDSIRMNESIVWDSVSWSNHYPKNHYAFMYKIRSQHNSVLKIRLADILLLKAEAYVALNNLPAAAIIVNKIRNRVKLPPLNLAITSDQDKMKQAVLKERRLELAFEGHRWFDLVRNDEVIPIMNTLTTRDSGRDKIYTMTEETTVLPIPQEQLDMNSNLEQNKGY